MVCAYSRWFQANRRVDVTLLSDLVHELVNEPHMNAHGRGCRGVGQNWLRHPRFSFDLSLPDLNCMEPSMSDYTRHYSSHAHTQTYLKVTRPTSHPSHMRDCGPLAVLLCPPLPRLR